MLCLDTVGHIVSHITAASDAKISVFNLRGGFG